MHTAKLPFIGDVRLDSLSNTFLDRVYRDVRLIRLELSENSETTKITSEEMELLDCFIDGYSKWLKKACALTKEDIMSSAEMYYSEEGVAALRAYSACRRAERRLVKLPMSLRQRQYRLYLNRLSTVFLIWCVMVEALEN